MLFRGITDGVRDIRDGVRGAPTQEASLEDEAYASCFCLSNPLGVEVSMATRCIALRFSKNL